MRFDSPLRYPGGKRKLAEFVADVVKQNDIEGGTYIEPFAGGASVALYLLFNEYVNQIIINDFDKSIYAFWYSILNHTQELCDKIRDTAVTIEEWKKQKEIQTKKENIELIDLGFSTFFLNRTNRSGVIKGGVIGGKEQNGKWRIDARYNKTDLIKRIEKISLYRERISIYNKDATDFINGIIPNINERTLIFFDPPYYNQGSALYVNHFLHQDHELLSQFIQSLRCKWMLTYDYVQPIVEIYKNVEKRLLTLSYSAGKILKDMRC